LGPIRKLLYITVELTAPNYGKDGLSGMAGYISEQRFPYQGSRKSILSRTTKKLCQKYITAIITASAAVTTTTMIMIITTYMYLWFYSKLTLHWARSTTENFCGKIKQIFTGFASPLTLSRH